VVGLSCSSAFFELSKAVVLGCSLWWSLCSVARGLTASLGSSRLFTLLFPSLIRLPLSLWGRGRVELFHLVARGLTASFGFQSSFYPALPGVDRIVPGSLGFGFSSFGRFPSSGG
jgi:hypothetical protein